VAAAVPMDGRLAPMPPQRICVRARHHAASSRRPQNAGARGAMCLRATRIPVSRFVRTIAGQNVQLVAREDPAEIPVHCLRRARRGESSGMHGKRSERAPSIGQVEIGTVGALVDVVTPEIDSRTGRRRAPLVYRGVSYRGRRRCSRRSTSIASFRTSTASPPPSDATTNDRVRGGVRPHEPSGPLRARFAARGRAARLQSGRATKRWDRPAPFVAAGVV
jgi:hypothetical protein